MSAPLAGSADALAGCGSTSLPGVPAAGLATSGASYPRAPPHWLVSALLAIDTIEVGHERVRVVDRRARGMEFRRVGHRRPVERERDDRGRGRGSPRRRSVLPFDDLGSFRCGNRKLVSPRSSRYFSSEGSAKRANSRVDANATIALTRSPSKESTSIDLPT
jgi:hypothetical protein